MEKMRAIEALSALAQETRLDVFRLLVQSGPGGLSAGEILNQIGGPANTLSSHLGVLVRAELATSVRRGRNIIYRPNFERVRELLFFLLEDCCAGKSALDGSAFFVCGAEGRESP
jgi:ArsR family transcriptional regulator